LYPERFGPFHGWWHGWNPKVVIGGFDSKLTTFEGSSCDPFLIRWRDQLGCIFLAHSKCEIILLLGVRAMTFGHLCKVVLVLPDFELKR
jgi:hypothetical protein